VDCLHQAGVQIWRLPVEGFPGHITCSWLILGERPLVVDLPPDGPQAREGFERGLQQLGLRPEDLQLVLVTHGHLDHFGLLSWERLRPREVVIHRLDAPALKRFRSHLEELIDGYERFFRRAGVAEELRRRFLDEFRRLVEGYHPPHGGFRLREVEGGDRCWGLELFHSPGHSPGHLCARLGGVVFLGDHLLSEITPHQSPREVGGAGLRQYLRSLRELARRWGDLLGLPAHQEPIPRLGQRAEQVLRFHRRRLEDLREICAVPCTITEATRRYFDRFWPELFGDPQHPLHDQFLAFLEVGAHLEYLWEEGRVRLLEEEPVRYVRS